MPWWWRVWQFLAGSVLMLVIGVPVLFLGLLLLIWILIGLGVMEPWS